MTIVPLEYRRKIKTLAELRQAIGPRPRDKKVIMCHGTFDLVHPGHVRHMMYAKSKADILIASLTSDAHINKANFRPYVPQDLRAMNLAAFEPVDYVIIDENATPLETIKYLQPDYFAKGYEYCDGGVHPRTQEELNVLNSYGGEVIFTPGDVVFSSSRFIENTPPNISAEKLVTLMESENITFSTLEQTLKKFPGTHVHVVGDTIVDSYTYCTLIGGMTKTPTFSLRHDTQVDYTGGAAIVSKHMRQVGADVTFSTVLGDDPMRDLVLKDLEEVGVKCLPFIDRTRPTTQKNVFIASDYRMLKVDKVDNRPISDKALNHLKQALASTPTAVAVFSDFRHGIFGRRTISELAAAIPENALRVADSQVASRWGNILEFEGFDLITPNEREARFAMGDQDSTVRPMARELYRKAKCKTLILKMGDRGILTYRDDSHEVRAFFTIDTLVDNLVDAVGAGDALLAYSTLALATTGSDVIASILGSAAAAVACENDGNKPVSPEDVMNKLETFQKRVPYACAA